MLTLVLMKGAADFALYYTFAGFFAALAGASSRVMLLVLVIQTAVFTLSYGLRRFGVWRLAPLALLALCWLVPGAGLADRIAIVPPALYLVYLVCKDLYEPDWGQQTEIFSVFWKALLAFSVFGVMFEEAERVKTIVLPFGLVVLMCSVLLMRSMRHEPQVYCQVNYQVVNVLLLCAVGMCVLFLSSDFFLGACLRALELFYHWVVTPVLIVFFYLLMAVIRVIVWLVSFFHPEMTMPEKEALNMEALGAQELFELEEQTGSVQWIGYIVIAIGIAAIIAVLILLFRALAGRGNVLKSERKMGEVRVSLTQKKAGPGGTLARAPVARVRAQYKKFLKLADSRSLGPEKSDTSLDINEKCKGAFDDQAVCELRELYIEARYDGKTTQKDVRKAKELYTKIKKSSSGHP